MIYLALFFSLAVTLFCVGLVLHFVKQYVHADGNLTRNSLESISDFVLEMRAATIVTEDQVVAYMVALTPEQIGDIGLRVFDARGGE